MGFIVNLLKRLFDKGAAAPSKPSTGEQEEVLYLSEKPTEQGGGRKRKPRRDGNASVRKDDRKDDAKPEKAQRPTADRRNSGPKRGGAKGGKDAAGRQKPKGAGRQEATSEPFEVQSQIEERVTAQSMDGWEIPEGVREAPSDVLFQDFPLDKRILCAVLKDLQFTKCSPIQALALPHALKGEDLAGKAQTGTGKTAAFLITVLQRYLAEGERKRAPYQPLALALAPTRELALQIAKDAAALSAYCGCFHTVAVYGGMDYDKQRSLLVKDVDLVVATPGRLIDYMRQGAVDFSELSVLIIDEADRMLDMGFIPDVKRIVVQLPKPEKRQTMLFSATLSHDIMMLASRWMRPDPAVLEVEPEHIIATGIEETIYAVTSAEKMRVLLWILNQEDCRRVLIFRNRRRDVEELHSALMRCGVSSEMLSGDVDQKKRLRILEDFRSGKTKVIVATDVAGRGIHVDDITHVVNYDLPYEAEDYVHRVGRTARAGHTGKAISFADEDCSFVIPEIEKYINRPLPITQLDTSELPLPEKQEKAAERSEERHGGGRHDHDGGRFRPSGAARRGGGGFRGHRPSSGDRLRRTPMH